jgi:large subunit ribosomal protein L13
MKPLKTHLQLPQTKQLEPVTFSAQGMMLGRLATQVAVTLRGKNSVHFEPNRLSGRPVIITHAEGIKVSGNKAEQKMYYRHTGYIGNMKSSSLKQRLETEPTEVIRDAIYGMLPDNRLRRYWMTQLEIRKGA